MGADPAGYAARALGYARTIADRFEDLADAALILALAEVSEHGFPGANDASANAAKAIIRRAAARASKGGA